MRIAQLAPLEFRVPPKKYGSIERIVSLLTEELVRRGHDVTLFASGDSITSAALNAVVPVGLSELKEPLKRRSYNMPLWHTVGRAFAKAREYDIIHSHVGGVALPLAQLSPTPVVTTNHGIITAARESFYTEFKASHFVAVSHDQHKDHARLGLTDAGVVHHGLAMEHYPFSYEHDGYLLCVGTIIEFRGLHHAIAVARSLGLPLIIAARLAESDAEAMTYFKETIEPELDDQIRWIGEVGEEERNRLMSRAMALLNPILVRETFGLAMIEAMACGTPVIAFDTGAVPEVVEHGKTGFVARNEQEMTEAVRMVHTINRAKCRTYALDRFSVARMVDGYERVYASILGRN